ncbi:MAG: hypothetical protein IJ138_11095, partial [Clostridia bacterium]|nr:hypothetical protein [Clostridia bacterium]
MKLLPYRAVLAKPIYAHASDSSVRLQNTEKVWTAFDAERAYCYQWEHPRILRRCRARPAQAGLRCVISSPGFTTKDHAGEWEHAKTVSSMPFFPLFSSKTCRGRMTGCRWMRRVTTFLRQPQ